MKCKNIKKLLSPYLDNQLSKKEQKIVEQHLKLCSKCRQHLEELKQVVAALKNMDAYPPPQIMTAKVSKYLEDKKASRWSILFKPLPIKASPALNYVALAFIVLIVALSVSYLYLQFQPFQKSEVAPRTVAEKSDALADKAPSEESTAPQESEKKQETIQELSKRPQAPKRERIAKDLKGAKPNEQLKIASQERSGETKADAFAPPKRSAPDIAPRRAAAIPEEKKVTPPAAKEKKIEAPRLRAAEEEKALDETAAIPLDHKLKAIAAAPGSIENPIVIQTDPLLQIVEQVEPSLPEKEAEKLTNAEVVLELVVDKEGKVAKIKVILSSGDESIDKAVIDAVKQWKFKPFIYAGRPAAVKGKLTFKFGNP